MSSIPSDVVEYRDIVDFPGYRVGSDGSVWSSRQSLAGKPLRPTFQRCMRVTLYKDGLPYQRMVHRLVLEAFYGPCPPGIQALHANDIPSDNRLENLRWGTPVENAADRQRNGRHKPVSGERHYAARLADAEIDEIRRLYVAGALQKDLAVQFHVGPRHISDIVRYKRRKRTVFHENLVAE